MKKYDEGYALPFVLVVFLVFSLIATSVLTFSLKNLQSQQASIQRAKDQYAAQGEIEKVVLQLESHTIQHKTINLDDINNNVCGLFTKGNNPAVKTINCSSLEKKDGCLFISFSTNCGGIVEIDCVIKMEGTIVDGVPGSYTVENPKLSYESYTVTTNGGGG